MPRSRRRRVSIVLLLAGLVCLGMPGVFALGRRVLGEDTSLGRILFRPPLEVDLQLWSECFQWLGGFLLVVMGYVWVARHLGKRPGRGWRVLVNGGLTLVTLLGGWVAVECVLRLKPITTDTYGSTRATLNWFRKYGLHNSWCLRGREPRVAKPAGTIRVVVIGDSVVFGHGVNDPNDRVTEVLERELNKRGDQRYEVLNLSDSGVATDAECGWLEFLAMRFDPDVVVLVHVFNDVYDSAEPSQSLTSLGAFWEWLRRRSYLADRLLFRARVTTRDDTPYAQELARLYAVPWVWSRHASIVRWFCRFCRSRDIPVIVGIHPMLALVDDYPLGLANAHRKLLRVCEQGWADGVDLRDAFAGHAAAELMVGASDRHPNELGHALMAHALVEPVRRAVAGRGVRTRPTHAAAVPVKTWPLRPGRAEAEQAVRLVPDSSRALAVLAARSGWMEGSKYLALALKLNPMDPAARFLYGRWWAFRYRPDRARDQYRALLELDPSLAAGLWRLIR